MNDLKRIFLQLKETTQGLGDIIILSEAVKGKKYPREVIRRVFNSVISKDEYEEDEKSEIIDFLVKYSQSDLVK